VFCPEDALLLELQPTGIGKTRMRLFWTLATLVNLKYVRVACASVTEDPKTDFSVDCKHLEDVLARCLPTRARPHGPSTSAPA
jgi:hypothetical protein